MAPTMTASTAIEGRGPLLEPGPHAGGEIRGEGRERVRTPGLVDAGVERLQEVLEDDHGELGVGLAQPLQLLAQQRHGLLRDRRPSPSSTRSPGLRRLSQTRKTDEAPDREHHHRIVEGELDEPDDELDDRQEVTAAARARGASPAAAAASAATPATAVAVTATGPRAGDVGEQRQERQGRQRAPGREGTSGVIGSCLRHLIRQLVHVVGAARVPFRQHRSQPAKGLEGAAPVRQTKGDTNTRDRRRSRRARGGPCRRPRSVRITTSRSKSDR